MRSFYVFLLASFVMLFGCNRTPVTPIGQSLPKLVWQTPLTLDAELASSIDPVVGSETVIFSRRKSLEVQSKLTGFDKASGERKWRFDDLHPNSRSVTPSSKQYAYKGVFAFSTKGPVYGIEIDSGKELWRNTSFELGKTHNAGFGDIVLHVFEQANEDRHKDARLGLANIEQGDWTIVYTLYGDEIWRPDVLSFTGQVFQGDTLVYISGTHYRPDSVIAKTFLIGYNVTTQQELFTIESTEVFGYIRVQGEYLFVGGESLHVFNSLTGVERWKQEIPGVVGSSGVVLLDDNVLVSNNGGYLFDPKLYLFDLSGNKVWESETVETDSRLIVHKGAVYGSGDRNLFAVDMEDGTLLWAMESPNAHLSGAFFAPVISIDPQTDRLYAADYLYALCYQLE